MKVEQFNWTHDLGWAKLKDANIGEQANLVLVFGGIDDVHNPARFNELRTMYPTANIVFASTAGEIIGDKVQDNTITATAVWYEKTRLEFCEINVGDNATSMDCGDAIREALNHDDLSHILVISDGSLVNGDELVRGINRGLPSHILVTGGLAADAGRFTKTYVGLNKPPESGKIIAIGHYGSALNVSHGSKGGWDEFGPIRTVTRSQGNVLFQLDGQNALDLYKKYLGEKATELPGAALLYPLSLYTADGSQLVRTILSIDEETGSMTFAGDIPNGSEVRFMKANFDRLIDGATSAAEASFHKTDQADPELVLMISCVGRKIILDSRIGEEVESVHDFFGDDVIYTGFYSNGEISPVRDSVACSLHNQTMTITTYTEN
jgi:hypothetical protein